VEKNTSGYPSKKCIPVENKPLLYQIRNLECSYNEGAVVLHVPELDLFRGELVFVVGISGGGKSTLIETLGLMNHTTRFSEGRGSVSFLPKSKEEPATDLLGIWDEDDSYISNFRKKYFSFIFQQTNLMPNFSAGENMLMTALLAEKSLNTAQGEIKRLMKRIGLPERAFSVATKELSGGQRQRLAFIRALVADYEVLFGDEPTGNLDEVTASDCFKSLEKEFSVSGGTGIIVSHDLRLACQFADRIVPISLKMNEKGKPFGTIEPGNIIRRIGGEHYLLNDSHPVENPIDFIRSVAFKSPQEV
jgi:ABC-type lipoprotein export system ATPase subunit